MTTEEIAQAMLEILSEEKYWIKYILYRQYHSSDGVLHETRCLLGARAAAEGMDLTNMTTGDVLHHFRDDEYLIRLGQVI